jgi:hypothetical protein
VTIVQRGGNRSSRFLEVVVYAMGGWRGLVLFPEEHDGRGWSRVSGKLSKVLAFLEDDEKMGKAAESMSFVEVVRTMAPVSVKGCRKKRVGACGVSEMETRQAMAWGILEENFPMGLDCSAVVRQPVDCFALEKQSFCPLGNILHVFDDSRCSSTSCRVTEGDVDPLAQENDGVSKKLLDLFREWIDWACMLTPILGLKCFGLKCKAGRMLKRAKVVLRRAQFRVESSSLGSKSITKKVVLVVSDAVVDSRLVSSSGFGFCGLVPVGMFGFPSVFGFCGCFFFFFFFFSF